jgi:hypothetical protein
MSEELFDCRVHLPHAHRAISLHRGFDHGPQNHAIAETKRLWSLKRRSGPADLLRNTRRNASRTPVDARKWFE